MFTILRTSICILLLAMVLPAQGVPIATIVSSHPTEITVPAAPQHMVSGRWRLVKIINGPIVIENDPDYNYPMIVATPELYVAQVTVIDAVPASSKRKSATGESYGVHKYVWTGQGNEPQPGGTGGQGSIHGTMDLTSWIDLVESDGAAGYATTVKVKCPELDVDQEMGDGLLKGTKKKKLFSFGFAWRGAQALFDVDTAVANGFYPGKPTPLEVFGGSKSGIKSCHLIQSTGATIEGWADGSPFQSAKAQAFSQGWSTYTLTLTD